MSSQVSSATGGLSNLIALLSDIVSDPSSSTDDINAAIATLAAARRRQQQQQQNNTQSDDGRNTSNSAVSASSSSSSSSTAAARSSTDASLTTASTPSAPASTSASTTPERKRRGGNRRSAQYGKSAEQPKSKSGTYAFYFHTTNGTAPEWRRLHHELSSSLSSAMKRTVLSAHENKMDLWNEAALKLPLMEACRSVVTSPCRKISQQKRELMLQEVGRCVRGYIQHRQHDFLKSADKKKKSRHEFTQEEWANFTKRQKRDTSGRFTVVPLSDLMDNSKKLRRHFNARLAKFAGFEYVPDSDDYGTDEDRTGSDSDDDDNDNDNDNNNTNTHTNTNTNNDNDNDENSDGNNRSS